MTHTTMNTDAINILVVDDVPQNLITIEALLARPGLNIIKASSGPEALEVMLVQEIALALLDVQMPQMDGFELAELIRGSERTRGVPLIFLTAGARESHTTFRGYEAGAVDFLYKPLDVAALKSKVNVFVELHAKEKQLAQQLEELRQALALNELFAAVLGHDLRNPLTAVMNGAELLSKVSNDPIVNMAATRIKSSGKRMTEMVDQLLDVARIRAGGIDLQVIEVDYEKQCRLIADELVGHDGKVRIVIEKRGDVVGAADPSRLAQILSNLLGNAIQHGTFEHPVRLYIDGTSRDEVVVSVQNSGVIPPNQIEGIFEPFYIKKTINRSSQGLGLGLFIVKKFTEAHQGTVTLTSDSKSGTIFRLSIPRNAVKGALPGLRAESLLA